MHIVQMIEIAPSIYTLRLRQTFEKLFTGVKVQRKAQKISAKQSMKSTPDLHFNLIGK